MRVRQRSNGGGRARGAPVADVARARQQRQTQDAPVTKSLLRLYVAGNAATSRRAEQNLCLLQNLLQAEAWKVEIVDVVAKPELAEQAGILATPTLSYEHPVRPRRIVGDLSDLKRVLDFLGIEPKRT
jgi:circadian clock protein KaiB